MRPLRLVFVAALSTACASPLWAAGVASDTTTRNKPPSSVRFVDSTSSEKPAAREKRLRRECRGRPNAGMCLGYTR